MYDYSNSNEKQVKRNSSNIESDMVFSATGWQATLPDHNSLTVLTSRDYILIYVDEETEAQQRKVTCPRP